MRLENSQANVSDHHFPVINEGTGWVTLESNQAWVAPAELQSAAAPCSTSPDAGREIQKGGRGVKSEFDEKTSHAMLGGSRGLPSAQ